MPPFHHHHHHHHHRHQNPPCCSSCCCCSCSHGGGGPSPPPPTASDHLLHLLAAHLLHQSPPPPPAPKPPPPIFYTHLYKDQHPDPPPPAAQIHPLLRRVAALESSLPNLPSPPPPPSLKDLAARTIQSHFRRLLLRRSQALRHLKHLAALKSHSAALKSSLSDKTHPDPNLIRKPAMDLLRELDSIQSLDPMIREGKRSISRELERILEFTEKVLIKEQRMYRVEGRAATKTTGKRVSFGESGRKSRAAHGLSVQEEDMGGEIGDLNERLLMKEQQLSRLEARAAEDGGLRPAAKTSGKRVSFGDDGRKSRAAHGLSGQEEDMGGEIGDLNERLQRLSRRMEDYSMVVEEAGGEESAAAYTEEKEDWELSPDAVRRFRADQKGLFAPLPVQMEPREGDGRSKKKVMGGVICYSP